MSIRPVVTSLLLKSSGIIIFLLLWEIAPRLNWLDAQFLPPFSSAIMTIHHLWMNSDLPTHIIFSLWKTLTGLLIASLLALPLGFFIGGYMPWLVPNLNPLFRILAQVNPFSLMPVFILFFGIGEQAKLATVAWVCFWPMLFYVITGVRNLDTILIKSALSMGVTRWQLFTKVLLPGAAPTIFVGLRTGADMAFFILIAAEMVGASAGAGLSDGN